MTPETRTDTVQVLEDSRKDFESASGGISEAQASQRPEPGRWSVLECVEHVAVVEERFLGRLREAGRLAEARIDKQKESELLARVIDRTTRAHAPEAVLPSNRFHSLAQALEEFRAARARTIHFAQESGQELYTLVVEHARFGTMNGAEFMRVIAGHAQRHAAQIREVRAALGKA
jgi:uncharacterized damage-inducible protein DinB